MSQIKFKNRCGICYFGKPRGEWMGVPICKECLSHRIVITEEMERNDFKNEDLKRIELPTLKSESEWAWWQSVARETAFNALDNLADRLNAEIKDSCELRHRYSALQYVFIQQRRSLLRLRVGFANMCELFFANWVKSQKDAKFWSRVKHNILFKYDKYVKHTEGYDAALKP